MAPWRATLVTLALVGLLLPLLLLAAVREPPRGQQEVCGRDITSWSHGRVFFLANRRLLLSGLTAAAAVVLASFGVSAWTPTFFVRHFSLQLSAFSGTLGLIMLVGGGLGTLAGASATDWVASRYGEGARLRTAAVAIILLLPTLAFALVSTPQISFMLYAPYVFLIAFAGTAATVGVQTVAPPRFRGLVIGVQAFMQVSIGLSLGPTAIALTTERVLGDPTRVGTAIFSVALIALLAALALLLSLWRVEIANAPTKSTAEL